MDEKRYAVTITGQAWQEAFDPNTTSFAKEHNLPEPAFHKRGRGKQAAYEGLTRDQVAALVGQLEELAELWATADEYSRRLGRVMARDAERVRDQYREQT